MPTLRLKLVPKQKLLITGATGFVGSNLVKSLVQARENYDLYLLVRDEVRASRVLGVKTDNIHFIQGSLSDCSNSSFQELHQSVLKHINVVIHLAAEMDFYPGNVEYLYSVNVGGTQSLLSLCRNIISPQTLTSFIYCSTTEVIGPSNMPNEEEKPANEESPLRPTSEYGKSKIITEKLVRSFSEEIRDGKRCFSLILRPTGIYGPGDRFTIWELQKMIEYGLLFFIPGSGKALLSYTHVDDVVSSILLSISYKPPHNVFSDTMIICPDDILSYAQWIRHLSKLLRRHQPILHLPFPLVKMGTYLLSFVMNIGKKRTFMYKVDTIERMKENRWYTNAKAKKTLSFRPSFTLLDGLSATIAHNIAEGFVKRRILSPFAWICLASFLSCIIGVTTLLR